MKKPVRTFPSGPIYLFLFAAVIFIFSSGCERDDELVSIVSFELDEPEYTPQGLETAASVLANRETDFDEFGITYSTNPNPGISDFTIPGQNLETSWISDSYSIQFTASLAGLSSGTRYYMRAYLTTRTGTAYSKNEVVFTP